MPHKSKKSATPQQSLTKVPLWGLFDLVGTLLTLRTGRLGKTSSRNSVFRDRKKNITASFFTCDPADQLQGSLEPFGPECSRRSVPRGVPGPFGPGLRSVQQVSRECLQSVKKVSQTLWGHSLDTFWTLRSPWGLPVGHSVRHPRFPGTLSGTLPATLGPL